jgi:hypothetical protein
VVIAHSTLHVNFFVHERGTFQWTLILRRTRLR